MAERFQRGGDIVQRIGIYSALYGHSRTSHAGPQIAVAGSAIHFRQFLFCLDECLACGSDRSL
jgi:hypothetical protein